MPDETITTIKVFKTDAEKLSEKYGAPQWRAFHLALAEPPCEHPESEREYSTATLNRKGLDADLNRRNSLTLIGFRCRACGRYVFPDPEAEG